MKKTIIYITIFLFGALIAGGVMAAAKRESSSKDAESVVAYGRYGTGVWEIAPLKVDSDGEIQTE